MLLVVVYGTSGWCRGAKIQDWTIESGVASMQIALAKAFGVCGYQPIKKGALEKTRMHLAPCLTLSIL